jgi:actin beta/gamma 1
MEAPIHICITGLGAKEATNMLLKVSSSSVTELKLRSTFSELECIVQEARIGKTLFTVSANISDQCAARWHGQSSTCGVHFHVQARERGSCEDLFKMRLMHQCDKPLLVAFSEPDAKACLTQRLQQFEGDFPDTFDKECSARIQWVESSFPWRWTGGLTDAMNRAIETSTASAIESPCTRQASLTVASLRACFHEAHAQRPTRHVRLQEEMMRGLQGLPTHESVDFTGAPPSFIELAASKTRNTNKRKVAFGSTSPLVIDNGDFMVNVGFANETKPRIHIPAVAGHRRAADSNMRIFVGDTALSNRGLLSLQYPMNKGVIRNAGIGHVDHRGLWADTEAIWRHAIDSVFQNNGSLPPVLLTEDPLNLESNRKRIEQIMFDSFNVPALYLADKAVMALYATSRATGCVVLSGDFVTYVVPVWEGYALPHAIVRSKIGGRDLTNYLMTALNRLGYMFSDREEDLVRRIKESRGYVAADFNRELKTLKESPEKIQMSYKFPNMSVHGDELVLGRERFAIPEALFDTSLLRESRPDLMERGGLQRMVFESVQEKADVDLRRGLYENVVLAGGNTMFDGMSRRLKKEIEDLVPPSVDVNVVQSHKHSSWNGGAVLAGLLPQSEWVTRDQHESGHRAPIDV